MAFTADEKTRLLQTALDSIRHGLQHRQPMPVSLDGLPESLKAERACFVTLKLQGDLRGCVGSIEPSRPLIEEVSDKAYAAAFSDQRFSPLTAAEFESIEISLSILTDPVPIAVGSTRELAGMLRPNVDGVIFESDRKRGVFLPQVWANLPEPDEFIRQLKLKAGLRSDIQPPELKVSLFQVESF